jgi:hypothetical protein
MGDDIIVTNVIPVSSSGGPVAFTNVLNTGRTSGTLIIDYHFYKDPDEMRIYYQDALIYDSGLVSYDGLTNINYGPGTDTYVTIIMDQGVPIDPGNAWDYTVTATHPAFLYTTFTDDTNLTLTPIKFAIPPFTTNSQVPGGGGIFYLPEEPLGAFAGQGAAGQWRLEIEDTRAGPGGAPAVLLGWQLALCLADNVPAPIPLAHHQSRTNIVAAGQTQYYTVAVPAWAHFATNSLLAASAPLTLLFNATEPPDVVLQPDDFILLLDSLSGTAVLAFNTDPPALLPGTTYYLAVRNTNSAAVTFCFEVDFDVPVLADGVPASFSLAPDSAPLYFAYNASTNATLVTFQIQDLTADADLYAELGLPFPSPAGTYEFSSTNPGTNDEQIVVFTNSFFSPLSSNHWYLGVFDADVTNVTGTIVAHEFDLYGTNVTLSSCQVASNALWVTWFSTPGSYYHVMGAAGLTGGPLTRVSLTLVASDSMTTFSLPLSSPLRTLVVSDGPAPDGSLIPPAIGPPLVTPAGIQLQWTAGTNSQFQIQWSPSISPSAWTTLPGVLNSPTGVFTFLDDGSQTGGLDSTRFYRLIVIP